MACSIGLVLSKFNRIIYIGIIASEDIVMGGRLNAIWAMPILLDVWIALLIYGMLLLLVHCKISCFNHSFSNKLAHISLFRWQLRVETRSNWDKLVWQFEFINIIWNLENIIFQLRQTYFVIINYICQNCQVNLS